MTEELKIIGKKVERVDALERLTGDAKFTSDIYLPGMLFAKVLRSPHPHARVVRIDAAAARALSGVRAILTAADVPDFAIHGRDTPPYVVMPVLASTARYAGDEILAVAAVDEETAEQAVDLIKVDYERLPFVLDPEEAAKPDAVKIYPEGNVVQEKVDVIVRGNIDEGFRQADVILEGNTKPTWSSIPRWSLGSRWRRGEGIGSPSGIPTRTLSSCAPTSPGP